MDGSQDTSRPLGRHVHLSRLVRGFGLRLLVWGGALALAAIWLGDCRFRLVPSTASQPEVGNDRGTRWPHVRGPDFQGRSDEVGLAESWPPEGPPLIWSQEIGRGYSGFSAAEGRLFTQTQTLTEQCVLALEAETGRVLWKHRCGWPYEPGGAYPGPRATPTWHMGRVYYAAPSGLVGCLDAADGRPYWSVNVKEKFRGEGTDFGYSCSPLVVDDLVVLPVGGQGASVVALDAADGSTVWASGDEPASYCSAMPISFRGRRQAVVFLQNVLASFDLESGRLLWQHDYSSGYDEHAAMPLYQEPYLMAMHPFRGGAELYRLEGGGSNCTARIVARIPQFSHDVASSALLDGFAYGFDLFDVQAKAQRPSQGEFRAIEFHSGKVRWSSPRTGHASVVAADGKLFLFNDRGEAILARASPDRYEELGRVQVFGGEICWTAPALYRRRLYLRSPTRAVCLYVGRPEEMSEPQRAAARVAAEVAGSGSVHWTSVVGGERPYAMDPLDGAELARWFGWSMLAALLAAVTAVPAGLLCRGDGQRRRRAAFIAFLGAAMVFGAVATPVVNRLPGQFAFTWPLSLFAAHQAVVTAVLWSKGQKNWFRRTLLPLVTVAAFVGLLAAYFDLCRRTGLIPAWIFLLGFVPSWPLAVPGSSRMLRRADWLAWVLWLLAFGLYFWASAAFSGLQILGQR